MCQNQSVGSYEQAGEVNRMELQRGHEDLYRKEPSENSSYDLPRTATLSLWLDQTQMLFCGNRLLYSLSVLFRQISSWWWWWWLITMKLLYSVKLSMWLYKQRQLTIFWEVWDALQVVWCSTVIILLVCHRLSQWLFPSVTQLHSSSHIYSVSLFLTTVLSCDAFPLSTHPEPCLPSLHLSAALRFKQLCTNSPVALPVHSL